MSSPLRPVNRMAPTPQTEMKAAAHLASQAPAKSRVEIIQPSEYVDRRAEPREDCNDRGALLFLATGSVVSCRILDQSPSGARVAFDGIGNIPAEIWLVDLDTNMVRRGTSAWSTPTRMGLKFNFVQTLLPDQLCPAKVPQPVYDAWLKLTGHAAVEAPKTPDASDDDVLYFD